MTASYLLQNQTTDTDDSQPVVAGSGGSILIMTDGTFDGATVTIQGRMHNFEWQDLLDEEGEVVEITAPTTKVAVFAKAGFDIRASLTSAGGSTDVSVGIL